MVCKIYDVFTDFYFGRCIGSANAASAAGVELRSILSIAFIQ